MIVERDNSAFWRAATPLIYATVFVVTLFLYFATTFLTEILWLSGGIMFWVWPFLVFGVVFGLYGSLLINLERLSRSRLMDHLRRSSLLYVGLMFIVSFMLLLTYLGENDSDYVVVFLGGIFAAYTIFVDALILLLKHRRSSHAEQGETA